MESQVFKQIKFSDLEILYRFIVFRLEWFEHALLFSWFQRICQYDDVWFQKNKNVSVSVFSSSVPCVFSCTFESSQNCRVGKLRSYRAGLRILS